MPCSCARDRVIRSRISSVTAWIEAATSMWKPVSGSWSGRRTGWPNSDSIALLVMVRPET